jgi:urocanate hydratase
VGDLAEHQRLEALGLTMYGQMTAGSWIYIGTQGIVQGTYETFAACAREHFGGDLRGRLVVTGGLGGMGGAQPLAATMNGGAILCVEVDPQRIERRIASGYLMRKSDDLDEALRLLDAARAAGEALSVGLLGNCAEVLPELVRRGVIPDIVTDQTSAHDELHGYVPDGMSLEQAAELRERDPAEYVVRSVAAMGKHVAAMRHAGPRARSPSTTATTSARRRSGPGSPTPSRSRASSRCTSARCSAAGRARFAGPRCRATPQDIYTTDSAILELFPEKAALRRWIELARQQSSSRASRAGSAGSATASATAPACCSTSSCAPARSRRRSSSAATTSTAAASPRPTARPRP